MELGALETMNFMARTLYSIHVNGLFLHAEMYDVQLSTIAQPYKVQTARGPKFLGNPNPLFFWEW